MHRACWSTLAVAAAMSFAVPVAAQETSQGVANGGISVPGWVGRIDPKEAEAGQKLENARLAPRGKDLHVTTGPAGIYWNPANVVTGNYTVSATFRESSYMSINNHPHPYGLFIGGADMGTDRQRYLYCLAYGNGTFIVRGFGPEPFQVNKREPHAAVNKAAAKGEPVEQKIAINVTADRVECEINGTVVASYPKSDVVAEGRLASTDGIYGIRFGHNTDATVTDLTLTKK
jgi:hypothetical protein